MREFTIEEVRRACDGEYIVKADGVVSDVAIDSRKVTDGTLFVPIAGERVDGHDYIASAFENGASVCLSEKQDIKAAGGAVIGVKSTVKAIGEIAAAYKSKYNVPTVAVTGSVGKTTTKDMIAAVMSKMGSCLKTEGNFNNELGLPLTVFRLEKEHKSAVLEMGMSEFGEIHYLADIARPDVAVITNVGMSHIENLGSREGILKAKTEIADFFGRDNVLIINADNDMLKTIDRDKEYRVITYAIDGDADYTAENIVDNGLDGCNFTAVTPKERIEIKLNAAGVHNVYNALSAIAVGEHFGISAKDIADAIESFELTKMRMTIEKYKDATLINDCYNASFDSIKAGLDVLAKSKGRRVAVLGDVLELGEFAKQTHLDIGGLCAGRADVLIAAGDNAKYIAEGAKNEGVGEVFYRETTDEAATLAAELVKNGDTILVKASRGMHFEKICDKVGESLK